MQYFIFGNEWLMGLRTKLNLLLLVVGALGAVLFATLSTPYLDKLAEEEVEQNARIMMASATGVRKIHIRRDRAAIGAADGEAVSSPGGVRLRGR